MNRYGPTKTLCARILGFWLLLSLVGCADPKSAEEQIRQMVAQGEAAVEAGSLTEVGSLISEDYRDEAGRTRRALEQLVAAYLLRHRSIHLLIQIHQIELEASDDARMTLYVAMAGRPLAEAGQLLTVRADLLRFDLELRREEGQWRVTTSRWRRASREDFLN